MWNTTELCNYTAPAFSYNTHAKVDLEFNCVEYNSNISNEQWSSVGIIEVDEGHNDATFLSVSDIIDTVKVTLGLPNKDIASIFRVSRQTLHSYKNSTDEHAINPSNQKRALRLYEIMAETKPKFNRSPGAMAKNYTLNGKSLLELLSEPNLDICEITKLTDSLSERMLSITPKNTATNEISLQQLTNIS